MVETLAGIWLFLLTAAAGFILGRYGHFKRANTKPVARRMHTAGGMDWQELLRFLQYDGSDMVQKERKERMTDNADNSRADTARVYTRRPL